MENCSNIIHDTFYRIKGFTPKEEKLFLGVKGKGAKTIMPIHD